MNFKKWYFFLLLLLNFEYLYSAYFSVTHFSPIPGAQDWQGLALSVFIGLVFINCAYLSIRFALEFFPALQVLVLATAVFIYLALSTYFIRTGVSLDFNLLYSNFSEAFFSESFRVLIQPLTLFDVVLFTMLGLATLSMLFACFRSKLIFIKPIIIHTFIVSPATLLICSVILYQPVHSFDMVSKLLASKAAHRTSISHVNDRSIKQNIKEFEQEIRYLPKLGEPENRDVFIVMLESFNGLFVDKTSHNGLEITPFFNQLKKQGVFVSRFYGNSVQTIKGQWSTLCSMLPLATNKVSKIDTPDVDCLPEILSHYGYESLFFNGSNSLKFDNTVGLMEKTGFTRSLAMANHMPEIRKDEQWAVWGIHDNILYQKVFEYLDQRQTTQPDNKTLVLISTITHHAPFESVEYAHEAIHKNPQYRIDDFENSLRLADDYLAEFINQLYSRPRYKDAIVLVLGDHSYPTGEHGSFSNENGAYEENFRVPFVVLGDHPAIKPGTVIDQPYSQLSVKATTLQLLGIDRISRYSEPSIFEKPPKYVRMLQPYNGRYYVVIKDEFKLSYRNEDKQARIYNLSSDPNEEVNLFNSTNEVDPAVQNELLGQLGYFEVNERFLLQNQTPDTLNK